MSSNFKYIVFILLFMSLSACSSRLGTDTIRGDLIAGKLDAISKAAEKNNEKYHEFSTSLNLARIYQMNGRWIESITTYDEAISIIENYEDRAIISVRNVAGSVSRAIFSRGGGGYYGMGYERSLMHTFNSLNYLMLGDFTGAAVELRKMEIRQERWLEESERRLKDYLESDKINMRDPFSNLPAGYSMADILKDPLLKNLASGYQDPFSYSLSGIVNRLADDMQYANISVRRAMLLSQQAEEMFTSAWGAKGSKGSETEFNLPILTRNFASNAKDLPATQEVAVIVLSGLAPSLHMEAIRFMAPYVGYIMVDLPAYSKPLLGGAPNITYTNKGSANAQKVVAYHLLRTTDLAYRSLQDEMAVELAQSIGRAVTRAGVSAGVYAGMRSNDNTENFAYLASSLTSAIADMFSSRVAQNIRNWELLPGAGYLSLNNVARGSTVEISINNSHSELTLPEDARGVIILVNYISDITMRLDYVTY